MKIIKELLGRVFALWGLVIFVFSMLLFFIPFILFCYFKREPLKTIRFISMSRVWMKIYLLLIGCPLRIKGKENFKKDETYIVVCNHNSLMDIPISSPSIPGGNKTIAKKEFTKIPLFGLLYKTGSIIVDRKSEKSRRESYLQMKEVLAMRLHMCVYPEGTRNKTNEPLKSFHDGAFKLSVDFGYSILPAVIFRTRKILPPGKPFFLWPQSMEIHFLPPVDQKPGNTYLQLKNEVFQIMNNYLLAAK